VNNDVSVTWTCLEAIVRFLEEQADGGAASPLIVDAGGICRRVGFDCPRTPWQLIARRLSSCVAARQLTSEVSVAPHRSEYLLGACVVFKRAADEVGLFDEQFYMFTGEIDVFCRLSYGGWTAWVLPSERASHYEGQTSRNHPDPVTASKFRQQSYRSICIYYSKHHSWFTMSLLRGMLAVRITLRLVRSLVPVSLLGDDERSPAEHLGALANVVGRCPSRPRERSLPIVPW
jgi:GT2 family glycosyltransferase